MFCILIHEKGGAERREVFEGSEISVGRVQGNELMLPKGNVSKRHARLLCRDGRFIVTDLNSTNGTYVNRRRITQATIVREGDRIYIGDFVLRIEVSGAPAEASVAVPVPIGPPPRPQLPTTGDSQPAALLRDDEEELTRSPIQGRAPSSPAASPGSDAAHPSRPTHSDEDAPASSVLLLEAAALLVERVARSLHPSELEAEVGPELAARIDQLLREAWATLSSDRAVSTELPVEQILSVARAELLELGPLDELLADPSACDIAVIGHRRVTLARAGHSSILENGFTCELSLRWAIARLCVRSGVPLGEETHVTRQLPDGTRLTAVLGQGGGSMLHLSRRRRLLGSLDDLVRRGAVSRGIATFLQQCLLARLNVLVVGPRDGGVELLLGALASTLPESEVLYTGDFEPMGARRRRPAPEGTLPSAADIVALAARAPVLRLFTELSEPSLTEAVVGAISDGADGVVATRYAGSVRRGLLRILSELRREHGAGAAELLAGGFEILIEVARLRDDRYRVLRVAEVMGTRQEELELVDVFTFVIDRTASGGLIEGSFVAASTMPAIADLMRMRGAPIESAQFTRSSR